MTYYAKVFKREGVYAVEFPELPNINTWGKTKDNALIMASDALNGALETDSERGFDFPAPVIHKGKNYFPIVVEPHIAMAIEIRKERGHKSQREIAGKLGVAYQVYQKLENPRTSNPPMKTLEKVARIYGKNVEVVFR
mgnify:FL=1